MNKLPLARYEDIVVKDVENEILIYDLANHKAYTLNETSAIVWNLCDGKTSVAQMAKQLSKKLNMPVGEEIVWLALDSFKKDNLLADGENIEIEYNGLSRRQVIRKVGLASLIALPVVSSLIAPTAAHAGSTAGIQANGTTCANPNGSECQSGFCTNTRGPAAAGFPNTGTKCCYAATAPPGSTLFAPGGGVPAAGTTSAATCANNATTCCSGTTNFTGTPTTPGNCTCG